MNTALVVLLAFNFVALSWFLLRGAQSVIVLDLDVVGEKLAADVLREWGGVLLDEMGTRGLLATRYMQLVSLYGLPIKGQNRAVSVAWGLIRDAQGQPVGEARGFAFYE